MVRNLVVLGGSSHPQLVETICNHLGIPPAKILLGKFAVGETRVEIQESVRGKDVYIIQSGGGKVNDHLMELLITISACKTASAQRVTAVLPLFPYSRQTDIPYNKTGAPLAKKPAFNGSSNDYTFESRPQSPHPGQQRSNGLPNGVDGVQKQMGRTQINGEHKSGAARKRTDTNSSIRSEKLDDFEGQGNASANGEGTKVQHPPFEPQRGYRQWVAQAGTLVADLLTCAGADHVITMDLHDPQYQGFFDIPVDNLYGRHLLRKYIQYQIPNFQEAVIVSPDAGGAKRATSIADSLGMPFALIHKVC